MTSMSRKRTDNSSQSHSHTYRNNDVGVRACHVHVGVNHAWSVHVGVNHACSVHVGVHHAWSVHVDIHTYSPFQRRVLCRNLCPHLGQPNQNHERAGSIQH